ncbi:transcriptional regulator [Nocardioides sp. zg-579]|uniref:Transcriptional regulator n=1 Tax=Nocardioides marmotae TaxID=2663857 RepID=A0A6I3JBQ3_9ACTN|nr:transcriptional regulator [Gordonia jinghuaiqii]MTB83238.1 transcriptional regulator [Nocardioides marmotae]MTB95582.1 transcriptional regulator [Nocardioides marmotae]
MLGVTVAKVRTMIRDHELAAAVPSPGAGQQVPADFIQDGFPLKGLPGLLTVLHDGGYDDRECIAWLYLDQELPGRPIDALLENRGAEVKRRAQAMAF